MTASLHESAEQLGDTTPGTFDPLDELEHPAITAARDATAMPWWFWEAAVVVLVGTLALSAVFPWGVAP